MRASRVVKVAASIYTSQAKDHHSHSFPKPHPLCTHVRAREEGSEGTAI